MAICGGASAAASSAAPVITHPDWDRKPTGEDVDRFYPIRAQRESIGGVALIDCRVTAEGALAGCKVASEYPTGYGFGEAALKMTALMHMKPKTVDGQPVEGGVVRIPMAFRVPGQPTHGEVMLQCIVVEDRGLGSCAVVSETPANVGYGVAALRKAATMKLSPDFGAVVPGQTTQISLDFDGPPPPDPAPAPYVAPPMGSRGWWDGFWQGALNLLFGAVLLTIACAAGWFRWQVGSDSALDEERDRASMARLLGRE